jgi:hypothetical protein
MRIAPFRLGFFYHLWPVRLCHNFPRYLINGTIFGKTLLKMKSVFWFPLQNTSHFQKNSARCHHNLYIKCPFFLLCFNGIWTFLTDFSKSPQMSDFMKSFLIGAEAFRVDPQTDRQTWHDDINSRLLQFCQSRKSYFLFPSVKIFSTPTVLLYSGILWQLWNNCLTYWNVLSNCNRIPALC